MPGFTKTIGYKHQDMSDMGGNCPCGDPGNYVCLQIRDLEVTIVCWCGKTKFGTFDDKKERDEFIAKHQ